MYKGEDLVLNLIVKKKKLSFAELVDEVGETNLNEDSLRRILEHLKATGYITTESKESILFKPTKEFEDYVSLSFPEFSVFKKALSGATVSDLSSIDRSIGIRWALKKGFVLIEGGVLKPVKQEDEMAAEVSRLSAAFTQLKQNGTCDKLLLDQLQQRHLVEKKSSKTMYLSYTGKSIDQTVSGFDVSAPVLDAAIGKRHPISKLANRIREIMAELGFEEMEGNIVESSFWNFDALFQPQDHPARELADTFYLKGEVDLPDDKSLIDRIKKAHKKGWHYKWDPKEARRRVLRTHTTCLSARYLANIKDKNPHKYFAIGRVFRNEATDYKHLAEFYQVEGIIVWDKARFTDLLGILKEFYRKLGFDQIRFRPSFFPYTEPSLEVEVYYKSRQQWMELGGAGIFRPEVSIPLANVYPVLAWGLSLERPLMLSLGLEDMRTLYRNELEFLKNSRLES